MDIHALHDRAKRFVVGAVLKRMFEEKESPGHLAAPLVFVVLDELNKYAPREGTGPIKEVLLDISERGRSLGIVLVGAQQTASEVEPRIVANAALRVVGRLDLAEAERPEYGFLTAAGRGRAGILKPGTMIVQQPEIPTPLLVRFPFPAWATRQSEALVAAGGGGRRLPRASATPNACASCTPPTGTSASRCAAARGWTSTRPPSTRWRGSRSRRGSTPSSSRATSSTRPSPPPEAEKLVYDFLARLLPERIACVVIAGNHDHPKKLAALSALLEGLRIHVRAEVRPPAEGGVVSLRSRDGREEARVAVLPFVPERKIVDACPGHGTGGRLVQDLRRARRADPRAPDARPRVPSTVNLVLAHLLIDGARVGTGERALHLGQIYGLTARAASRRTSSTSASATCTGRRRSWPRRGRSTRARSSSSTSARWSRTSAW